jgi:hypothetical protein
VDIAFGGPRLDVRFDFHDCQFPFLEILVLVAQPQFRVLATPSDPSPFTYE